MRILDIGMHRQQRVVVLDEPGQGNACHDYRVEPNDNGYSSMVFADIHFQNGPIAEAGVNGCGHEDLLAIIIDRLRSFQTGPFSCRENALALTKCEEALHWLNHRTAERQKRGVEGTHDL